jgi:O-acetyl-ADP-ribose deacetylase (regulator of RNase III)
MTPTLAVIHGSLTQGDEDVLVNASNTQGELGSGVSGAIARACGPGFQAVVSAALKEAFGASMAPGDVLLTSAGKHARARHVAHVAVMDYRNGFTGSSYPTLATVERGCALLWNALETLPSPSPLSIALPALGAGTGQLGVRGPTQVACRTLAAHVEKHPQSRISRVVFYGFDLPEFLNIQDEVKAHFPG